MAEFLRTKMVVARLEEILEGAKNEVTLVTPYLQISKTLNERLQTAGERGVKIRFLYGKDELKPNQRSSLAKIANVELYYYEDLHAKCYYNEEKLIITSMNMYEASEVNREMGILLDVKADNSAFKSAIQETEQIIAKAEKQTISRKKRTRKKNSIAKKKESPRGYCIRCEDRLEFNMDRPFCGTCYQNWSRFSNPEYEEKCCHSCGEYLDTSMEKPICMDCWKELN